MPLSKAEWEEKRNGLEDALNYLASKKDTDYKSFKYTCEIYANIYNESFGKGKIEEFMDAISTWSLYDLSMQLTIEEYGNPL